MKLILRYLKPFFFSIILCLTLLFIKAMSELFLPNLMSDIVNIGIQQGGIESAAPDAISKEGLSFIKKFMTDDEQELLNNHYRLISPGAGEIRKLSDKYPAIKEKPAYILHIDEEDMYSGEKLEEAFGRSVLTFIRLMQHLSQSDQLPQLPDNESNNAVLSDIDLQSLYALTPIIENLPSELIEEARKDAELSEPSLARQTGAALIRLFYTELGADLSDIQRDYIIRTGAYMLLVTLIGAAAAIGVGFLATQIGARTARTMRRDLFSKVESFSLEEFDRYSTASLITRTTNDVTQIQMMIIMGLRMMSRAPIMGFGGIVMALKHSISLSWIIALAVIILIGVISVIFAVAVPKFKLVQELTDKLNLVSRESLTGMMVIRAFSNQKHEEKRFEEAARELKNTNRFVSRVMHSLWPSMALIMNLSSLVIIWAGAHEIQRSAMQVGDMMAFIQYAMHIIMSFMMIAFMFIMLPRAMVSATRVEEVLKVVPSVRDKEHPAKLPDKIRGEVVYKNVSFRYTNAESDAVHNISFTARPGETTAIIGSTGSGKTTLVNLLLRFYDATEGEITIDGIPIKDISQKQLRDNIGYVPQKSTLFTGDIASNIRYGKEDASDEEVENAAEIAQADEFISAMEEGFKSPVAQGGANVSGGQKQRLSIARALVKKAPIYIFDDSFSALDFKTDAALRRALQESVKDSTIIIIAQRISTIMNADQIIVMDEGRAVGIGKHKDLLKTCREYREIAESQLSMEELA
jgi:ATP-binding cassette subfamily B multidrug efflux pump